MDPTFATRCLQFTTSGHQIRHECLAALTKSPRSGPNRARIWPLHIAFEAPLVLALSTTVLDSAIGQRGGPEAVEELFAAIAKDGYNGAMIGGSMFFNERKLVGAAALANKVPTISLIAEACPTDS
jgi:hypothetical protein